MTTHPPVFSPQLRIHARFFSRALRNSRDLVVWLPPGYGRGRRRHPVVYFQDGQNLFDPRTAFQGRTWRAGETAARLVRARRITPPILVGVGHAGADRLHEYAPVPDQWTDEGGARVRSRALAKRYTRFLAAEVKPFIDSLYLTLPGPRTTAVAGSSMGGLAALYAALWHPRVFGAAAALSPSLWWGDRAALRDFAALRKKPDLRLWLDTGTAEPNWEVARLFRDTLTGRGWRLGRDLAYREVPGAGHDEAAWGARLGDVLHFLVGREAAGAGGAGAGGRQPLRRAAAPRKN